MGFSGWGKQRFLIGKNREFNRNGAERHRRSLSDCPQGHAGGRDQMNADEDLSIRHYINLWRLMWLAIITKWGLHKKDLIRVYLRLISYMGKDLSRIKLPSGRMIPCIFFKDSLANLRRASYFLRPPKRESSDGGIGRRARLRI